MTAIVRRAELQDAKDLALLSAEVQALHHEARPDHFKGVTAEELAAALAERIGDASTRVWVAQRDEELAAYAVVRLRSIEAGPYTHARTWWELDQLAVTNRLRRSGLAAALLRQIVSEARVAGAPALELQSWAFNVDAQRAFAKLGFVPKVTRFELPLR